MGTFDGFVFEALIEESRSSFIAGGRKVTFHVWPLIPCPCPYFVEGEAADLLRSQGLRTNFRTPGAARRAVETAQKRAARLQKQKA